MSDKSAQMSVADVRAMINQLTENYQLTAQGPGTAMLPREVASGLIEIAILAHGAVSLLYHLCGYSTNTKPGDVQTHAAVVAMTPHGEKHLGCMVKALDALDEAMTAGGFPAHRDFPACAETPGAKDYTQGETNLLHSVARGNA